MVDLFRVTIHSTCAYTRTHKYTSYMYSVLVAHDLHQLQEGDGVGIVVDFFSCREPMQTLNSDYLLFPPSTFPSTLSLSPLK